MFRATPPRKLGLHYTDMLDDEETPFMRRWELACSAAEKAVGQHLSESEIYRPTTMWIQNCTRPLRVVLYGQQNSFLHFPSGSLRKHISQ